MVHIMSQKPSVGRIVHYTSYGTPGGEYPSVCRAAVVTAVHEFDENESIQSAAEGRMIWNAGPYFLDLCVLNPEGMFFNRGVRPASDIGQGGSWHWPERVD